jgi:hypothetical protein
MIKTSPVRDWGCPWPKRYFRKIMVIYGWNQSGIRDFNFMYLYQTDRR